jgi:hypothetical protein
LIAGLAASAQQKEILLWPIGAPGSEGKTGNERKRKEHRCGSRMDGPFL